MYWKLKLTDLSARRFYALPKHYIPDKLIRPIFSYLQLLSESIKSTAKNGVVPIGTSNVKLF